MLGRIPKRRLSANIEDKDFQVLQFAGWNFSREIREYCHSSADIYRRMLGTPILEKIVEKETPTNSNEEDE